MSEAVSGTVMTTAEEPDGAPRLAGIDILRGIAILGILFMNINAMGASLFGSESDIRSVGWGQADQVAWWIREVFWTGTARCTLEMLFGVGMVILTERAAKSLEGSQKVRKGFGRAVHWVFGDGAVMRGYYVRNIVLFLFGLAHVFILLWPGDILHTYGLAALVAFLFRRLGWRWLLGLGLLMATLQLSFGTFFIYQARTQVAAVERKNAGETLSAADKKLVEQWDKRSKDRAKQKAEVKALTVQEDKDRSPATGTFQSWAGSAWGAFIWIEKQFLEILFVWEAAGTMLVGAALFKLGIVQGARSTRFYLILGTIMLAFGIIWRALAAQDEMIFTQPHAPVYAYAVGEYARIALTIGYICLVQLILASPVRWLLKPFTATGRVALSVYIGQTIICLWVLYPPFALALYGKMTWWSLMVTAFAVNVLLVILANLYVTRFRIGPVEWAWRSVIARKLLPIRKRPRAAAGGAAPLPA